ncbi:MAG TPA: hypothetical protein VGJ70_21810 [Solirubrobacteraceae bacterium]
MFDSWPAYRRSPWVMVVDLTLPLTLVFWAVVDMVGAPVAHLERRNRALARA